MSRFPALGQTFRVSFFAPAAVVLALPACMSWRSEPLSPAQLIATKKPPVVRVTRTDSSQVILKDPKTTLLVAGIGVATFAALCAADAFGCGSEDVAIADAIWTK